MINSRSTFAVLLKELRKADDFDSFAGFTFELFEWLSAEAAYLEVEEVNMKYCLIYTKRRDTEIKKKRVLENMCELEIKNNFSNLSNSFQRSFLVQGDNERIQTVELKVYWSADPLPEDLSMELDLLQPVLTLKMEQLMLSKRLDKYEQMLANSMDVMMLIENREIEYISPQVYRYMGYNKEELRKAINEGNIFHPGDKKEIEKKIVLDAQENRPFSKREYRLKLKNGKYRWIEWVVRRIFDEQGDLARMIVNFRDVTEKKEAQEELEHQKVFLQDILDRLPVDIYLKDKNGRFIFINKSAADSFGKEFDELIGKTEEEISHKEFETVKKEDSKVFKGAHIQRLIEKIKGEKSQFLLSSKQLIRLNNEDVLLAFSVDITEEKENERKLQESTEFINRSIQIIPDSIFIFDLNTFNYVFTNDKIFEKLGFKNMNVGKSLRSFIEKIIHPDDAQKYFEQLNDIRQGKKELYELEFRVLDNSGKIRWLFSRKTPIKRNKEGFVDQFVGLTFDITEQKNREHKLIKTREKLQRALNSREEFLSMVSHEIRTPLNAIVGISNLLSNKDISRKESEEMLRVLRDSGNNLLLMINDILDFSKIQAGEMQFDISPFNIYKLVKAICMSYIPQAKDKGLEFHCDIDKAIPEYVLGDPLRLNQILNNLISNSIKFTSRGKIHCYALLKKEERDSLVLEFKISDTGIGIPKNKQKEIYDPFKQVSSKTTRKYGGTGLGLSITKELVEKQGGVLNLESQTNKGSTFSVIMSFGKTSQQENGLRKRKTEVLPPFEKDRFRLLYVEDVASNRYLMKAYCARWNLAIDVAETWKSALKLFEKNNYDLILMDVQMPEKDGFETLEEMQKIGKTPPVLALSADVSIKIAKQIRKSGMAGYITKPIQIEALHQKIAEILMKDDAEAVSNYSSSEIKDDSIHKTLMSIYGHDGDEYSEYIAQVLDEIKSCGDDLIQHLREKNLDSFSNVCHKMIGPVGMFGLYDLKDNLDAIKFQLEFNKEALDISASEKIIDSKIKESIKKIRKEKNSLLENRLD